MLLLLFFSLKQYFHLTLSLHSCLFLYLFPIPISFTFMPILPFTFRCSFHHHTFPSPSSLCSTLTTVIHSHTFPLLSYLSFAHTLFILPPHIHFLAVSVSQDKNMLSKRVACNIVCINVTCATNLSKFLYLRPLLILLYSEVHLSVKSLSFSPPTSS